MSGDGFGKTAGAVRSFTETVECPHFAVAVTDLAKAGQCLFVLFCGLLGLAETGVQDSQAVQRPEFAGAVTGLPAQGQGLLEVFARRPVTAQADLSDAQVDQGAGRAEPVADLPAQGQRPVVMVGCGLIATQPLFSDAEAVEGAGFARSVTGPPVQVQSLLEMADGRPVVAEPRIHDGQVVQCARLAGLITGQPEQAQSKGKVVGRRPEPAQPQQGQAETGQRGGLTDRVVGLPGGAMRVPVSGDRVGVVPAVEVAEQDDGQPDRVGRPAVDGRVPGDGDQCGAFRVQPRASGARVGQVRGGVTGCERAGPPVPVGRVQGAHGRGRGGQVVVEQAGQRGAPLRRWVVVIGPADGVLADEVVQGVPARTGGLQQMVTDQGADVDPEGALVGAGQGPRGVRVEVRARMQRHPAQQLSQAGRQLLVGQIQGELYAGVELPLLMTFVEPVGVVGECPAGPAANVRGDQAESEGQVAAAGGDAGKRSGIRAVGDLLDGPDEEPPGLGRGEQTHRQVGRPLQLGQAAPAGDQRRAARDIR